MNSTNICSDKEKSPKFDKIEDILNDTKRSYIALFICFSYL